VLELLSAAYANHASTIDSALPLENAGPDYEAAVVLFSDMAAKLPRLIQPEKAPDV
jgi:hypothetical protein